MTKYKKIVLALLLVLMLTMLFSTTVLPQAVMWLEPLRALGMMHLAKLRRFSTRWYSPQPTSF